MKRARVSMTLLAVTALGGGTAQADTTTPTTVVAVAPRTLASGAPACGNVMLKARSDVDPLCAVFRQLRELEALGRKFDAELKKLDVKTAALTVPAAPRPRL